MGEFIQRKASERSLMSNARTPSITHAHSTYDDIITVNVSGKKYFITKNLLLAEPKSKFVELLAAKQRGGVIRPDNIYLDSDPKIFRHVLHYLRCVRDKNPVISALPCKADDLTMLMTEAQSLRLESLMSLCASMLKRYLSDETTSCEYTYVKEIVNEFEQWVSKEEGW